jgi:hypothetical protein
MRLVSGEGKGVGFILQIAGANKSFYEEKWPDGLSGSPWQ